MTTPCTSLRRSRCAAGLLVLALACACGGGDRLGGSGEPPKKELRTLRVDKPLPESPQQGPFSRSSVTHYGLLERIATIAKTPHVSAVLLQLGEFGSSWSQAADLRDALLALKRAGKPLHCYFENTDNLGFALLVRVCDRISMSPGGFLDLVGVSAELVYARELLHTVGISADLIQVGRFKGAADALTRDEMPAEVAETMNAILDELQGELVAAIAAGRKLAPEQVKALIDQGPFTAETARAAGLVDAVSFDDEARARAKQAGKAERIVREQLEPKEEGLGLGDLLRALTSDEEDKKPTGDRLVLAYLDGTIMRGSESSFQGSHADPFVKAMREFADDPGVKAVVLRIDSPGGSALASDLMWHAVRRVAKRKPVIVSLGDVAASGGYYVASAGTEIVAQDHSLVGSIGVVGGKIVGEELADKLGVNVQHLTRGRHADWGSPVRRWSDEQRQVFERALRETYDRFLARIAEGRGKPRAEIEPLAQGRLLTARTARAGGLVDRDGGLVTALARARERAKLPDSAAVQVWPEPPGLFQALSQLTSGDVESKARSALLAPLLARGLRNGSGLLELLLSEDGLRGGAAVLPYMLSLR